MVIGILRTIELEPGDELIAVNWHISRTRNFKEIVARSENDTVNLRVIVFSDITPRYGEEWYGRAMIRTKQRGWNKWISVDIITLNREDSLNNITALPSPVSTPNLITTKFSSLKERVPKDDILHTNHPLTNFHLNVENSFKVIGEAKLVATSYWIEDINDQVVWKRIYDTKNLTSVKFNGFILDREKIYRARAVFHTNTQDVSDPASYRFKTIGDYNYALRVFLENQFFNKLNHPGNDEEGNPLPHPLDAGFDFTLPYEPGVTDRWIEIHKIENGDMSEVFKLHLQDGNRDVNIAPGVLEKNSEYLIFFKTKEDDPLDTIVLNTYEYKYEEVLPEGEADTPDFDVSNPVPDTPIKLWSKQVAEVGEEVHIVATGTYKLVNFTFVPNSVTVVDKTMHKVTIRLNKMEDIRVIASGMGIPEVSKTIKVVAKQEIVDTPQVDAGSGGPTDVTYHPDKNTYNPGDRAVVVGPFGSQGVFLDPETGGKVTEIAPGVYEVVFGDNLGQVSISVLPGFNRDKTIEIVAKQEVSVTPQEPTDRPITYVPSKDTYDYNDKIIVTGPVGTTGIELEPASHLADVVEIGDGVFEITIKHPTDLTPVFKPSNKKGDVIKTTKDDDLYLDLLHINLGDFLYKYCTDFDYARRKTGYVLSGSEDMFTEQTFLNKIKEVNFYSHHITSVDTLTPLSLPMAWGCLINNAFIPFFDKEYFKENVVREDGVVDWYMEDMKDPTIKAKYRLVDPDKHWDKIKELNTKMVRDRDQTYADNFLNNDRWGLLDIKGLKTNKRTASLKNAKEYLSKLARSTMGMSYVPNCKFVLEEKFAREHPQTYYEILNYVDINEQGGFSLIDPKTKHPAPYRKLVELVTASDGNYRNGAFQPGGNYSNGVIHEYLKFISTQLVAYHAVSGFYHNGVVKNISDIAGPYSFIQAATWIRYYGINSPTIRNSSDMNSFIDSAPITSGDGFPLLWRFLPKQFEPPKIPGEEEEEEIFTQDQIVDRRPVINIEDLEPLPPEEEVEEEQPPKELTEAEINNILDYDLHQLFNWALASEENTEEFINFYYEGATGHFLSYATAEQQWCSKIQDYTDIEKRIWMIYNSGMYVSYLMYSKKYRNTLNPSTRSGFTLAVSDPQVLGENLKEFMKGAVRGQFDQEDLLEPLKSMSTGQEPGPEVGAIIEKENGVLTSKYQEDGCTIVNARDGAGFFAVFWRYHLASLIKSNCDSDRLTLMLFGQQDHTGATRPAAKCPIKAETFKDYTLATYSGSTSGSNTGSSAGTATPSKPVEVPRYEPVEENWPLYINPYKLNIVNQFSRLIARPEETLEIAKTFVNQATGNNERFAFTDFEGMISSAFFNYGPYVKKHKNLKTSEEDLNAAYLFTISEMIFKMVFYRDNFTKNVTADTVEGYFKWNVVNNFLKAMKSYAGKYAWAESGYHEHMKKAYIYSISQFDYSNSWTGDGGASGHNHSKFFDMLKFLYGNENVEPYLTTNPSNGNMALEEEGWTKSYLHPTKGGIAIMMKNIDDIEELFTLDKTYFTNLAIASAIESNYSEEFKQKYKDYDLRYRHQVFYQQRTAKKYYSWILPMYYAILQAWKSINMYRASKGQVQIPELKLTKAVVAQALLQSRDSVDNPELIYIPKLDLIKPRVDSLDKEIYPD